MALYYIKTQVWSTKYSNVISILFRIQRISAFLMIWKWHISVCLHFIMTSYFCLPTQMTFSWRSDRSGVQVCLELFLAKNQCSLGRREYPQKNNLKIVVMGSASCVQLEEDVLKYPDTKLRKEGKAFKLKKTLFYYCINKVKVR